MKKHFALAAGLAALLSSGAAMGADINGSLKDSGDYTSSAVTDWSGWYVTGKLGVSKQEYEGSRNFNGGIGAYKTDKLGGDRCTTGASYCKIDGKWTSSANFPSGYNPAADNTTDNVKHSDDYLTWRGSAPFGTESDEGLEGSLELSRMFQVNRGFVLEPYVSVNLPLGNDNRTGVSYKYDAPLSFFDVPTGAAVPAAGYVEAEKLFDAGLGLKIGFVPISRLYLYAGAGVNWGFFNLKGHNDANPGGAASPFATSFDSDDDAIGYEVLLGSKYAVTNRVILGVEGSWKEWTGLEAGATRVTDVGGGYIRAGGKDEVDANEWAVKGTLTIKLSD